MLFSQEVHSNHYMCDPQTAELFDQVVVIPPSRAGHLNDKVNNMSSAVTADTADTADTRDSPDPSDVMSRVQVLIVVVTEIEPEALGMLLLTMVSPEKTPVHPSLQD